MLLKWSNCCLCWWLMCCVCIWLCCCLVWNCLIRRSDMLFEWIEVVYLIIYNWGKLVKFF